MAAKSPDQTITEPNFASAEYAEQWRRGKRLRREASEAVTKMMLDLVNLQAGDRVLELAAGMGELAVMTARRVGPSGFVLASDISTSMLNQAAETAREAGVSNIEIRVMNAENLDVAPDSFNAALCSFALMFFPNRAKVLIDVYRALKPAGRFAVAVWSTAENNPFHALPLAIVSRLAKLPAPAPGQPGMFALSGPGVLEECYRKAGFRDVAVHAVPVPRTFPSIAEAVSAMKDSFPRLQTLLTKLSDAERAQAWSEIEQQLRRFEGPDGFNAPGERLVGVGTK